MPSTKTTDLPDDAEALKALQNDGQFHPLRNNVCAEYRCSREAAARSLTGLYEGDGICPAHAAGQRRSILNEWMRVKRMNARGRGIERARALVAEVAESCPELNATISMGGGGSASTVSMIVNTEALLALIAEAGR